MENESTTRKAEQTISTLNASRSASSSSTPQQDNDSNIIHESFFKNRRSTIIAHIPLNRTQRLYYFTHTMSQSNFFPDSCILLLKSTKMSELPHRDLHCTLSELPEVIQIPYVCRKLVKLPKIPRIVIFFVFQFEKFCQISEIWQKEVRAHEP